MFNAHKVGESEAKACVVPGPQNLAPDIRGKGTFSSLSFSWEYGAQISCIGK